MYIVLAIVVVLSLALVGVILHEAYLWLELGRKVTEDE